ncbi:MAG TPA: DUF4259 domain-containing protein [Verrucomicrobiae bacterium]|nr:DUF4259 domain-containing protein [Verrucomicrobiae bacterium]
MGAWGAGSFQNDWALDWLGDLRESGNSLLIVETLSRVVQHGGTKYSPPSLLERLRGRRHHTDWLDADVSSGALAAAEIVAAWLGHPPAKLPDGVIEWVQQHLSSLNPDIVPLARQAVNIVRTNSELKDLWEEGDATEWHQVVQDLDKRLQS